MKIYKGQEPILEQAQKGQKKNNSKPGEFQEIMNQVNTQSPSEPGAIQNGDPIPVTNGIHITNGPEKIDGAHALEKKQVMSILNDTLDLIDFYAEKLGDTSVPTTDMTSLVEHLEDKLGSLNNLKLTDNAPKELHSFVSDITVTLSTEIEKFKRGDYY